MNAPAMPTPAKLQIQLNGEMVQIHSATLAELLDERGFDVAQAMACAVNRRFVPRTDWAQYALQPGDAVEVVSPVVGG